MDALIPDVYAQDYNGGPNIAALKAAGHPWSGIYLKVSEGTWYPNYARPSQSPKWFRDNWPKAVSTPTFHRGGFHYANLLGSSAAVQANWFAGLIKAAGGCHEWDLPPMLDMENGDNPAKPGSAAIEKFIQEFAATLVGLGMQRPILYGNIYLRENGVVGLNGCSGIIIARYTKTLPGSILTDLRLTYKDLAGWQYSGTECNGAPALPKGETYDNDVVYPGSSPLGKGLCDITAWQRPFTADPHPYK